MDLTLLEISLEGARITANAPFSGHPSAESDEPHSVEEAEHTGGESEDTRSSTPLAAVALAALCVLAIAIVLKRRRSTDSVIEES